MTTAKDSFFSTGGGAQELNTAKVNSKLHIHNIYPLIRSSIRKAKLLNIMQQGRYAFDG